MLVVDADSIVRLAIDRQLDVLGWDAYAVNTGTDALHVIAHGLDFEVLLTDVSLPDLDGHTLAEAVRRLSPPRGVVFMSRLPHARPLERRCVPFLLKPFSTAALADALSAALALRNL